MKNVNKLRKSSNVQDFRNNPAAANAAAIGDVLQTQLDNMVMTKNEVSSIPGPTARAFEKKIAYDLDEVGTKGKGRLGGGRAFQNRVQKVTAARQPIKLNNR